MRNGNFVRLGVIVGFLGFQAGCQPVRYPCVAGIDEGHSYTTTLTQVGATDLGTGLSPCSGIAQVDDLTVGSVVVSDIPAGAPRNEDTETCQYPTAEITSDVGLTNPVAVTNTFAVTGGDTGEELFTSAYQITVQGCVLVWKLTTFSQGAQPIATPKRLWAARFVGLGPSTTGSPSPECTAAFPELVSANEAACEDAWDITLQTM